MSQLGMKGADVLSLYASEFWDLDRHRLVAVGAEERLTPEALAAVRGIAAKLDGGKTLVDLAGWADTIKGQKPSPNMDEDTKSFLEDARNANHRNWHFVNLPLGAAGYDRERYPEFTRDDDVVQMIEVCGQVLAERTKRFSMLNALRMLVHLVGDVHQPLHVACSYLDRSGDQVRLVGDPDEIRRLRLDSDRGGNSIVLPLGSGRSTSLHSYWDGALRSAEKDLIEELEPTASTRLHLPQSDLKPEVFRLLRAEDRAATGSAAEWASLTIAVATEAYRSLKPERVLPGGKVLVNWESKTAYDARCRPLVTEQIQKAATNLAAMLNSIFAH